MTRDQHRALLARHLARYYANGRTVGPCACIGFSGYCTECPYWWELFLKGYDYHAVEAMVEMYEFSKMHFRKVKEIL